MFYFISFLHYDFIFSNVVALSCALNESHLCFKPSYFIIGRNMPGCKD